MKTRCAVIAAALILALSGAGIAAQAPSEGRTERVRFAKGASSAVVRLGVRWHRVTARAWPSTPPSRPDAILRA